MPDPEALLAAVRAGDAARVRTLLAEDPSLAEAEDEHGTPAVRLALHRRKADALAALLEAGPRLGPLDLAALGRADELARAVELDPGVVTQRTHEGFTALHLAAFTGGPDVVRVLLAAGADPNADTGDPTWLHPLHAAAAARDGAAAHLLLEAGADPDARQAGGFTALHAAAMHDDEALAADLLRHGADPGLRTDEGATAAAVARSADAVAVLGLLGG
jgi:ankyrin repeat protein